MIMYRLKGENKNKTYYIQPSIALNFDSSTIFESSGQLVEIPRFLDLKKFVYATSFS